MNTTSTTLSSTRPMAWCLIAIALLVQCPVPARADPVSDGKAAFAVCSACHSIAGASRLGPPLNGVIGRKAGSVVGFNYSPAMRRANVMWDAAALEHYIENPQKAMPGNRMPFAGLPDETKRADIAAYLATLP
jgi:cytochrome c